MAKKTLGEAIQSCNSGINKLAQQNPELAKMYQDFMNDEKTVQGIEQIESKVRDHIKTNKGVDISKYLGQYFQHYSGYLYLVSLGSYQ